MYVIFSDVDGTIYRNGPQTLETRTVEDIKLAQSRGVEFIITTGNAHLSAILSLATKLDTRYLITSSGAVIYDFKTKQFIRNLTLPKEVINKVTDGAKQFSAHVIAWNYHGEIFVNEQGFETLKKIIREIIALKEEIKIINHDYSNLLNINKIIIFGLPIAIEGLIREFKTLNLNLLRLDENTLEVVPQKVSKGEAVEFMINYLKTDYSKVMTIGDGKIDESMLALPVTSYALANSDKSTKEVAKYHTSSVEQNGLGMAIVDFLYRKKLE